METICWEHFKHRYGPQGQLKAWADYQRAYRQWRQTQLAQPSTLTPERR
ncbi:hypothetical protein [Nodosilinea sp. P-1105]|nr:hypothetical protein [Nodosilinea sp. P-1105]